MQIMEPFNAVAVGPGCGSTADILELVKWLYTSLEVPLVIDADGLNVLAQIPQSIRDHPQERILTPHLGEFARLTNSDTNSVQANREALAVQFAEQSKTVLLLKGHRTIISDGQRLAVNSSGNSGMATGGSGDVLTGLIVALLAQGLTAFDAAQLAAHLHGRAGDLAAADLSQPGLIASDLPRYLAQAWKELAADNSASVG